MKTLQRIAGSGSYVASGTKLKKLCAVMYKLRVKGVSASEVKSMA